jgi:hypothetical protein
METDISFLVPLLLSDATKRINYEVHLQAIRMANDDGSNEALVTPANVLEQVMAANQIWRPARIQIKFDPMDFVTRRNTALNLLNPTKNSHVDNAFEIESALALGDEFLGKIVVIYRKSKAYASDYYTCGPGCGFSTDAEYKGRKNNYVVMPEFDSTQISLLAHEGGHYFGLSHTDLASQRNMMTYGDHMTNLSGSTPTRITINQSQIDRMQHVLEQRRLLGLHVTITPSPQVKDVQLEEVLNPNQRTTVSFLAPLLLDGPG